VAALNFNIFHKHADRVHMTNIAQMVNVLQAMILTDKEKMILTPTYRTFKMYVPFQDATALPHWKLSNVINWVSLRYLQSAPQQPKLKALSICGAGELITNKAENNADQSGRHSDQQRLRPVTDCF
jgi:alpha-L-arabinofuranosidase